MLTFLFQTKLLLYQSDVACPPLVSGVPLLLHCHFRLAAFFLDCHAVKTDPSFLLWSCCPPTKHNISIYFRFYFRYKIWWLTLASKLSAELL